MTLSRLSGPSLFMLALLSLTSAPMLAWAADDIDLSDDPELPILASRDLARTPFEASQASVKNLARRRLEAIREAQRIRMQEYLAGRGTLQDLRKTQYDLRDAQRPLKAKTDVNREALDEFWRSAWRTEKLSQFRFEAGQVKAADYFQSLYVRLDAELQLALTRPKKK